MIVKKVKEVYKILLRNCDSYEDLLKLLKEQDAPRERVAFIDFLSSRFYTNDDFIAIYILVERNIDSFDEETPREVMLNIFNKLHGNYLVSLI